jgi:predicted DCC family thiol-disulfide oxidoreductase YuxK
MSGQTRLTVYYDGACPVCSREMGFYQRQAGADDIQWVDVATCDPGLLAPQLDRDRALARLHVRREDGELVDGTAAFAAIWRQLPRLSMLGVIASWRPIGIALELGYGAFLRLRRAWRR